MKSDSYGGVTYLKLGPQNYNQEVECYRQGKLAGEPVFEKLTAPTREEMCVKFCEGLPDGSLSTAVKNGESAMKIWTERDNAFRNLAVNQIPIFDGSGRVSDGEAAKMAQGG